MSRATLTFLYSCVFFLACKSFATSESFFLADVSKQLERTGFKVLLTPELKPIHLTNRPFVDQIFKDQNKAILLKFFSDHHDTKIPQRLVSKQHGFMYSAKLPTGKVVSFFFYRMSKNESQSYIL